VMVLHHLVGWLNNGIGGKFQNNSKMVQAGIYQESDIVTTMSI
jgi:hypothetical protein